ncbi:MAG TPA: hypothetical protein GX405_10555 [Rhizobiales bacterium]|nr:hypothetical protein [Hyphomicrobiales bacterium]
MARLRVLILAGWLTGAPIAAAQQVDPSTIEPPLYPEIVLDTDDSYSSHVGLTAFREALVRAGEAVVRTERGEQYDPAPMLTLLADEVEFFVAAGEGDFDRDFVSLGLHPAARALEMAGRLSKGSDSADPIAQQRYGMHMLAGLAAEPAVGRTPWLAGRVCTASYGRLSWPDWVELDGKLRFLDLDGWRIASVIARDSAEGLLPADWPKRYQMVPVSPEQKRSGGTTGIIPPHGGTVFFRTHLGPDTSYFARYYNSHLCFEEQGGAWKVSAIAMRLD